MKKNRNVFPLSDCNKVFFLESYHVSSTILLSVVISEKKFTNCIKIIPLLSLPWFKNKLLEQIMKQAIITFYNKVCIYNLGSILVNKCFQRKVIVKYNRLVMPLLRCVCAPIISFRVKWLGVTGIRNRLQLSTL